MNELNLDAMEVVLKRNHSVAAYYKEEEAEIYLTNQNLIITTGTRGKRDFSIVKIRLLDIRIVGENPQITIIKDEERDYVLTIFCSNAAYQIDFSKAKDAELWRTAIIQAMSGSFESYSYEDESAKKAEAKTAKEKEKEKPKGFLGRTVFGLTRTVASLAKSGYEGIKSGFGIEGKSEEEEEIEEARPSILEYRNQEENIAKMKEEERLRRAKLALEFENGTHEKRSNSFMENHSTQESSDAPCFCSNCGEKLSASSIFCHKCGTKVK